MTPVQIVDHRVRVAAFQFLTEQVQLHGDVLSRRPATLRAATQSRFRGGAIRDLQEGELK